MTNTKTLPAKLLDSLSSFWLSCSLLTLIGLTTFLGTLYQVEHGLFRAQEKYFDSWFYWQSLIGPLKVVLPGGFTLMLALFINLICGGIVRLRRSWRRVGILFTHLGIALLLIAGFVRFYWADEGIMMLREGQTKSEFQSHHFAELAILEPTGTGTVKEHLVPHEWLNAASGERRHTFRHPDLPFDVVVHGFLTNARVLPKGPMFDVRVPVVDGFFLKAMPEHKEHERNLSGCYVDIVWRESGERENGLLWAETRPWTVGGGDKLYGVELRKKRYALPFAIELKRTHQEFHPGTSKAKEFWSDVRMIDGAFVRDWRIEMNAPLRHRGFVVYQSQWDQDQMGRFSGLAVAQNPSDQWPMWACFVIAFGLVLHFGRVLLRFVGSETRKVA